MYICIIPHVPPLPLPPRTYHSAYEAVRLLSCRFANLQTFKITNRICFYWGPGRTKNTYVGCGVDPSGRQDYLGWWWTPVRGCSSLAMASGPCRSILWPLFCRTMPWAGRWLPRLGGTHAPLPPSHFLLPWRTYTASAASIFVCRHVSTPGLFQIACCPLWGLISAHGLRLCVGRNLFELGCLAGRGPGRHSACSVVGTCRNLVHRLSPSAPYALFCCTLATFCHRSSFFSNPKASRYWGRFHQAHRPGRRNVPVKDMLI